MSAVANACAVLGAGGDPDPEEHLVAAERQYGYRVPEGLREVVRYLAGFEWCGPRHVVFFDVSLMDDVARQLQLHGPTVVPFADDGGSNWYGLDTTGALGGGVGAVWRIARGTAGDARFVTRDVVAFLHWVAGG